MATSLQGQPGAGGFLSGLDSLFKNKLFLQYLSAAGADIAQGTGGKNVNAATQQNIAAQNYSKLLAQMLGGDFSGGGKITMDSDGATFKVPAPVPQQAGTPVGSAPNQRGASPGTGTGAAPVAENLRNLSLYTSPFGTSQSGISASDLAGLSPEMIASALQFKFGKEEFEQRKLMDVAELMYRGAQLESDIPYRQALTNESLQRVIASNLDVSENTPIFDLPGTGLKLTRREAVDLMTTVPPDDRTALMKEYEFAMSQGFDKGFMEFKDPTTTTDWRNYQLAGGKEGTGKSFDQWLTSQNISKATRITLGEKLEEVKARSELAGELAGQEYFAQVDWPSKIQKEVDSDPILTDEIFMSRDNPQRQSEIKSAAVIGKIKEKIAAGRGVILGYKVDAGSNTITYTVRWPSGKVEPIAYIVK